MALLAGTRMTAIDVVVPSYARPILLERCLVALAAQTVAPRSVVVVARPDDAATWAATRAAAGVARAVSVEAPGVVAALRAGVAATTGDAVAFTDDDAEPEPEWLARIAHHLARPGVGGVGGRDHIAGQTLPARSVVGRRFAFGRTVGDHHLGVGPARPVDILKGVNMAFRVDALALARNRRRVMITASELRERR
jgi:cellulose synthase/poly-beta-1,6-N-acetylglucosamine synthase-like glycosyltransferase